MVMGTQKKKSISSPQKKKAVSQVREKQDVSLVEKKQVVSLDQKKQAFSLDQNLLPASEPQKKQACPEAPTNKEDSKAQKKAVECKETTETVTSTSTTTAKRVRGINTMHRIVKRKIRGVKKAVEFTKQGQPRGVAGKEMQSYIGVLTRTKVPIDIQTWNNVDNDTKNKIWEAVEMAFVLAPQRKKLVLQSASRKWREFKSRLTNTYILPFKDSIEKLSRPPEKYKFIEPPTWNAFVASRLTKEFLQLHKEQQERRAQLKYNNRMSRGGYVRTMDI